MPQNALKIAVLLSGNGTTLQNLLDRAAMGFAASVQGAAGGREVDAKSLLSVLALGAKGGTELRLTAAGEDAAAALDALSTRVQTLSD